MKAYRAFKELAVIILVAFCYIHHSSSENILSEPVQDHSTSAETQTEAVKELLKRLLPNKTEQFEIQVDFDFDDEDAFEISSEHGKIRIVGNKGYTTAAGLHHYLKTFCGCHISWSGYQLNVPESLPRPTQSLKIVFNDKYRYYQNVCTSSYSFVWWTWDRWEREIDWMALNGINLPLAFNAQEAITSKVFRSLNFTQHDVNLFFTGPAFLAWNRMGNMQFWGGPLSDHWHESQVKLQHRILDRLRDFGMTPVLPAFSGRVVPGFNRLFPNTSTTYLKWGNFKEPIANVTFLDPLDPLFQDIAAQFLRSYIEEFGTNHMYNVDLFNEMPPPSNDPNYLKACAKSFYDSLTAVDPEAVWITQGWMFYSDPDIWQPEQAKAFLTGVPLGKMIILDLQSELYPQYHRLSSYYGQPFIWCMLNNYGGVTGLYASLEQVNNGTFEGREYGGSTMVGTGLAPEGIESNDIAYELMNEMAWRKDPVNLDAWLNNFAKRRYGVDSAYISDALTLLKRSVYNASVPFRNHGKYILIRRPSLRCKPYVWYDPKDVFDAWKLYINASKDLNLQRSELYRHDLVDITRQSLQLVMDAYYALYLRAFRQKKLNATRTISENILELFDDMDEILASNEHFLLGKWLDDAKGLGIEPVEKRFYEYNARNQITLWGPNGEILDYANKQWAGLMKDYYKERWQLFFNVLNDCLVNNVSFDQSSFNTQVFEEVETKFNLETKIYPKTSSGDSLEIAKELYRKYGSVKHMFRRPAVKRLFRQRK